MKEFNPNVSALRYAEYIKTIQKYIEMFESYKFAFNISEFGSVCNYILDTNSKNNATENNGCLYASKQKPHDYTQSLFRI